MTKKEMKQAVDTLTNGNVTHFCEHVGITRQAYYRATWVKGDIPELTAMKIEKALRDEN